MNQYNGSNSYSNQFSEDLPNNRNSSKNDDSSHISMDDLLHIDDDSESAGPKNTNENYLNNEDNNVKAEEFDFYGTEQIKEENIKKDEEVKEEGNEEEFKEEEIKEEEIGDVRYKKEKERREEKIDYGYRKSKDYDNSEEKRGNFHINQFDNTYQGSSSFNSKDDNTYNSEQNKNPNIINQKEQKEKPNQDFRNKNKIEYPTRPVIPNEDRDKFTTYKVQSNFFKVLVNTDTIYKYSLEFSPHIEGDAVYVRKRILYSVYKEIEKIYGNFHYNGTMIFAPNNLQFSPPSEFQAYDKMRNPFTVIVKYAGQCDVNEDSDYMPIIKSFCKKSLAGIGQVNIKGAYFSDRESKTFKEFKFQLWQGFKPSVKRNNNTFYINLLPLSKVIRTKSALDELKDYQNLRFNQNTQDFQNLVREKFRNASVLTRYNGDKNYVIIDIDFAKSPNSQFFYKKENRQITFMEYYKTRYQNDSRAQITQANQPLLVALDKRSRRRIRKNIENNQNNKNAQKNVGYSEEDKIYLIPELCYMTGYTDEMRKNFKLMKTVSDLTKKNICDKMNDLSKFVQTITESKEVKKLSQKYPINFDTKPQIINVKLIDPGYILMKNNSNHQNKFISLKEDNLERLAQTMMFTSVQFNENDGWMVIFYSDFRPKIGLFYSTIKKVSEQLGCYLPKPFEIILKAPNCKINPDKAPEEFYIDMKGKVEATMRNNSHINFKYSLFIMKGANKKGFMYKDIKGFFLGKIGMVSQCILENTITKSNLYSILAKLIHEINAKLDCQPWIVQDIGLQDKMTMFFSYYSVGNVIVGISSADRYYTQYFNSYQFMHGTGEFQKKLKLLFFDLLNKFMNKHKRPPQRVLVLRDANINPKQMNEEIFLMKETLQSCPISKYLMGTTICYVHCSSKHNLKIIGEKGKEIKQGTIVDEVAVSEGKFEFYLISQKCKEGIPMATKYTVIHDDSDIKTIDFYSTILKMCFLYYNRLGGVKLPAPLRNCKEYATLLHERIKFREKQEIHEFLKNSTGLYYI